MKVGFVYDPIYLKHDTGQHVENAKRLEAIVSHLEETGITNELVLIKPRAASVEELSQVHDRQHISHLLDMAARGGGRLDLDTVMSADSYKAAIYAAGGAIAAAEAVINDEVASAFALVRPPGHHATRQRAMGFCLFNNLAIAAKHILTNSSLERIAIVDFDVHHGNGTQATFYNNPAVLYASTHEYPFYPGTGGVEETGDGEAKGTTVNIPLPAGCGDEEYLAVFQQIVSPAVKRFVPQLILVSAGYDAHWADSLALMQVTTTGFAQMARIIKGIADELCLGRLVICLEGGYHLQVLAYSVQATFDVLLGNAGVEDPLGPPLNNPGIPSIEPLLKRVKEIHALP